MRFFVLGMVLLLPTAWATAVGDERGRRQPPALLALSSGDVVRIGADGRERLIARADSFVPSPDGRWIAFSDNERLFVSSADGRNRRLLSTTSYGQVAWSPAGDRLLFDDWEAERVVLATPAGRVLGGLGENCCVGMAWSPDGRWIAGTVAGYEIPEGVILFDRGGKLVRWLYRGPVEYENPVWSPDSGSVAFVAGASGADHLRVRLVGVKGRLSRDVARAFADDSLRGSVDLAWAPGRDLVVSARRKAGAKQELRAWSQRRGFQTLATGDFDAFEPAWSPDGRTLALVLARYPGAGRADLETDIATLTDGRLRRLTHPGHPGRYSSPVWTRAAAAMSPTPSGPKPSILSPIRRLNVAAVAHLDARGGRVVSSGRCAAVTVWNPSGTLAMPSGCEQDYQEIEALRAVRDRFAWILSWTDRTEGQSCVVRRTFARPLEAGGRERCLQFRVHHAVSARRYIDAFLSDGSSFLFSVSDWCGKTATRQDMNPCQRTPVGIFQVTRSGVSKVAEGAPLLAATSRFLVRSRRGRLESVDRKSRTVRRFPVPGSSIAVSGARAVIVEPEGTIAVVGLEANRVFSRLVPRRGSFRLPRIEAFDGRRIAYVVDGLLFVARLSDRAVVQLAVPGGADPIRARFDSGTLVVGSNLVGARRRGRLAVYSLRDVGHALDLAN
jgi:Tol biopolymer transport system component